MRLDLRAPGDGKDAARDSLSAVVAHGPHLWLGNDEGIGVDRLTAQGDGGFGEHANFPLLERLDMPRQGEEAGEIDIEGLDVDGGALWLVGSHTWTRGNPKKAAKAGQDPLAALADIDLNLNRHLLAKLPLEALTDGSASGLRRLRISKKHGALIKALSGDPLLGPFLDTPAKENGFDIEGLAARGDRLFLGLRGPVLRGYAFVLEIRVAEAGKRWLKLEPLDDSGACVRKHVLHLGGNGIRDLCWDGDDLLILAGPTADIDGRCYVWRWRAAASVSASTFTPECKDPNGEDPIIRALELPVGDGADHPEGIALLPTEEGARLLVVYDSPAKGRRDGKGAVDADLFETPV